MTRSTGTSGLIFAGSPSRSTIASRMTARSTGRNAGEILHEHTRRPEGNFAVGGTGVQPGGDRVHVVDGDAPPVLPAQQVFQQDLKRTRQAREVTEPGSARRGEAEEFVIARPTSRSPAGLQTVDAEL